MRVTLKLATSLDGRIATAGGESKWITGPEARAEVHRLRAVHAAVLVGVATAIADDPDLTVRLPDFVGRQPARVVFDSSLRLPLGSRLVATAKETPTLVSTIAHADDAKWARLKALSEAGVEVLLTASMDGRPHPTGLLERLEERGLASLMIEGGGQVAASFLEAGVVDAVEWFRAPTILGDEGRPAIGALAVRRLDQAPRFRRTAVREVGSDLWESYERA